MILSCYTYTKVEAAGQPISTSLTWEAVQWALTAPTAQPYVAPTKPKQDAAQSPTATTHTQQMTPAPKPYNYQVAELMLHLTNLVMSERHHNAFFNRCKYNCDDVAGWAIALTHNGSRSKDT